ncbi:hypothetical protein CHLRE_02g078912v5 [Chlamydomonas reinhardtii]|uniref:Uncharacterized protein n=1 Tax=Chlamydomonas reinhardtii TaxID=3055 RepID=A0A2K3E0F7_CHLRE|nr:uncharacterized protein CHLRE_02g078912v5 [Chlamydomonas reinhardtii]PNW86255.1 hypothetical protein CHLRE_02g078912v5 [Chlamydomonas reinhardtii]
MSEMESLGAAPILNDGQVAGNCAISPRYLLSLCSGTATATGAAAATAAASGSAGAPSAAGAATGTAAGAEADTRSLLQSGLALVSMSGKPPGHRLDPARDFVLVQSFDRAAWSARYRCAARHQPTAAPTAATAAVSSSGAAPAGPSAAGPQAASSPAACSAPATCGAASVAVAAQPAVPGPAPGSAAAAGGGGCGSGAVRPSSDSPLLAAALSPGAAEAYGWALAPTVVLHGHALAEGEGLAYAAEELGLPISQRATLFSTPEDLAELESVFRSHPYPQHTCYIRRGHGFFLLADCVAEARRHFESLIVPWLRRCQQQQQP